MERATLSIDPWEEIKDYVQHPTGLLVPKYFAEQEIAKKRRPIAIDIFAGCGGFSLGFMKAGFEVVAAVEWDVSASITYLYNLGAHPMKIEGVEPGDLEKLDKALQKKMGVNDKTKTIRTPFFTGGGWRNHNQDVPGVSVFFIGDVRKLTGERILQAIDREPGEVDVVMGGPPCQGFSRAGKRNVMDPRNSLVFDFARLILEINPKTMIMENVPGIATMVTPEGIPVMDAFCQILESGGFGGFDALKKALSVSAGLGGAMKGIKGRKPSKQETDEDDTKHEEETQQLALL